MTAPGLFGEMRDRGFLRGTHGRCAAAATFALLTTGRALSPLGALVRRQGPGATREVVRRSWHLHHGEARPIRPLDPGARTSGAEMRTMVRVALEDGVLDPDGMARAQYWLAHLDLEAPLRAQIGEVLEAPGEPEQIVRSVHTIGEALVLHVVARSVRAPGLRTPHALQAALDRRLPIDGRLLARLDDAWIEHQESRGTPTA